MRKAKVLKDFSNSKYSDKALEVKVDWIISKMTGNVNFPEPTPALAELGAANELFKAAVQKTEDGTHEDTVIKNQRREDLVDLLQEEADYVQITSKGDEAIILSSGFDTAKSPSPVGPLPKPTGFTIEMGPNKGSVFMMCDSIKNKRMYLFEYRLVTATGDGEWHKKLFGRRRFLITDLTSGAQYEFRMAGVGSDDSLNYSDVIISYVI